MHSYLDYALRQFTSAKNVEDNENKIDAIVGLYLCRFLLGDENNLISLEEELNEVQLTMSEKAKSYAMDITDTLFPFFRPSILVDSAPPIFGNTAFREKCFEQKKQKAADTIKQIKKTKGGVSVK